MKARNFTQMRTPLQAFPCNFMKFFRLGILWNAELPEIQPAFTCSKSIMEMPEQNANNGNTRIMCKFCSKSI